MHITVIVSAIAVVLYKGCSPWRARLGFLTVGYIVLLKIITQRLLLASLTPFTCIKCTYLNFWKEVHSLAQSLKGGLWSEGAARAIFYQLRMHTQKRGLCIRRE